MYNILSFRGFFFSIRDFFFKSGDFSFFGDFYRFWRIVNTIDVFFLILEIFLVGRICFFQFQGFFKSDLSVFGDIIIFANFKILGLSFSWRFFLLFLFF